MSASSARAPAPTEPHLTLAVLGPPELVLVVYDRPASQGSKQQSGVIRRRTKDGRVVTVPRLVDSYDQATRKREAGGLSRWRAAVAAEALKVCGARWTALEGPLVADTIITLPRTSSVPKTLRTLPHTGLDLSKLARATEDALGSTCAKLGRPVIRNDAQITDYRQLRKVYEADVFDPDALRRPGVVLRLWKYPSAFLGRLSAGGGTLIR